LVWKCRNDYPVLVSNAVKGISLQEALKRKSKFNLVPQAFSQQVLVGALVSFEDNKPDNLILISAENGHHLCAIDADRCFVPPFKNNCRHAKDIVFCLEEMTLLWIVLCMRNS